MKFTAKQRVKKIVEWATGDPNYVDDMQVHCEEDVKVILSQEDLYNIEDEIRTAYELGYQEATKGISLEESMYGVDKREELEDADYGDCTRLHFNSFGTKFVLDLCYRRGDRDLAETSIGIFREETVDAEV